MEDKFQTILLAVIYNPKDKKILIARRENDPVEKLGWCFPGGKPDYEQELEESLKNKIKNKTGFETSNLGAVFIRIAPEKRDQILIYYLCEVIGGEEKPGDDLVELKWVDPEEVETHFTTSFHPNLKEYVMNLK